MRWLLITTTPGEKMNPGDQFIRLGVQAIIRQVDPLPQFDLLNKEDGEDLQRQRPFDKSVLCGMPMWWNNPVSTSQSVGWWGGLMCGWPSARKNDFLILGAGSVVGDVMKDHAQYLDAIKWSIGRAFAVTTRNPVVDWPYLISSICPSAFSPRGVPAQIGVRKLANIMLHGAHDRHLNRDEAKAWDWKRDMVAHWARSHGFEFVAHSPQEAEMARKFGFAEVHFFPGAPESYLKLYSECGVYVGNRLHGAMLAAASGAKTMAIGYDSRIRMLDRFNVTAVAPSEIRPSTLHRFMHMTHSPHATLDMIEREREKNVNILRRFIRA